MKIKVWAELKVMLGYFTFVVVYVGGLTTDNVQCDDQYLVKGLSDTVEQIFDMDRVTRILGMTI